MVTLQEFEAQYRPIFARIVYAAIPAYLEIGEYSSEEEARSALDQDLAQDNSWAVLDAIKTFEATYHSVARDVREDFQTIRPFLDDWIAEEGSCPDILDTICPD